jgi:hypothetical protein
MASNELDLLKIVKRDNDAVIAAMNESSGNPQCDELHRPITAGVARSIRVQEIVLEHVLVSTVVAANGAANSKAEKEERVLFGFIKVGTLRAAGLPAVILAGFIGYAVVGFYHTKAVAEGVKQEAVAAAQAVAAKVSYAEHQQMNRDQVRTVLLEMIRETQVKTP